MQTTVRPDFIPEGQEHLWPPRRDRAGVRRDFIPDDPDGPPAAIAAPEPPKKGAKASE